MIAPAMMLLFGCLTFALGATSPAHGHHVVVGVNVVNPQRLSPADRAAVIDQLQMAEVKVVRVPFEPPWRGNDFGPAIDFIRRAYQHGIKTDVIIGLQYREGARRRPAVEDMPNMWSSYPLSSADPARFRAVFEPRFNELEALGITLAALELGNEINWAGFNGEFPIPGEGRVFGLEDLQQDPEARQVAEGYRAYLRTLSVLKDIRDHSRFNRTTPILSAGLSDPGSAGPRPGVKADAVTITATLEYLRGNGIDALVDAYGVHTYPSPEGNAALRLNQLKRDTLAQCEPLAKGKPCWLTEWGLPAREPACRGNDAPRNTLMQDMLIDFRQFVREGRLTGLLYYAWTDDKYGIYRCDAVTDAGRVVLDQKMLE